MDAPPQRSLKVFRGAGDENAAPLPLGKPTLHQRHKSTGTLLGMSAVGALRATAKRAAFGDISNTTRALPTIKDDSAVGKQTTVDFIKPTAATDSLSSLLRPVPRPLSAAPLKAPMVASSIPSDSAQSFMPLKSTGGEYRPALQPVPKQSAPKRAPAVFKDVDTAIEKSVTESTKAEKASTTQDFLPHELLPAIPEASLDIVREIIDSIESQSRVDGESVVSKHDIVEIEAPMPANEIPSEPIASGTSSQAIVELPLPSSTTTIDHTAPLPPLPSDPVEARELEELESDEELATAYSFRSRGDNTTGGATVIMAPHVTLRSRQELAEAKLIVESTRTQDDVDDEAWDTSMVAEYGDEIFTYMRELESRMQPNPYYMDNQAEIQWSMRSVLMDWLIQVHHRFALLPETLFLCVNYIDRFLSCKVVSLGKLQLVGATAIFVAAKYEEINCPSVQEIVYMVDGGYTTDEILKAERYMLSMLQFELGWPGPMSFLRRISKADDYDLETRTLAKYFLEVTIMDERFVGSVPSYVAAGAHALARFMLKKGDWTAAHAHYSGYTWTQLRPLVSLMMECCRNPQKHHGAVFEKYSDRRYKRASIFVRDQMESGFVLPAYQPSYIRPSILSPPDYLHTRSSYESQEPPHKRIIQAMA